MPNVDELRELFAVRPLTINRLNELRTMKLADIREGRFPVPLEDKVGTILLQIVPFSALSPGAHTLSAADLAKYKDRLRPLDAFGFSHRINFHGLLNFNLNSRTEYLQAYRNGVIETVKVGIVHNVGAANEISEVQVLSQAEFETNLVESIGAYLSVLADLAISPPYAILVSLRDVHNAQVDINKWRDGRPEIKQNPLVFDEVVIEEMPIYFQGVAKALRPIFDQLANAGGRLQSEFFRQDGEWSLTPRS